MSSRQRVQKQRKLFSQRSQERSEELSAERCQESTATVWTVFLTMAYQVITTDHLKDRGEENKAANIPLSDIRNKTIACIVLKATVGRFERQVRVNMGISEYCDVLLS